MSGIGYKDIDEFAGQKLGRIVRVYLNEFDEKGNSTITDNVSYALKFSSIEELNKANQVIGGKDFNFLEII